MTAKREHAGNELGGARAAGLAWWVLGVLTVLQLGVMGWVMMGGGAVGGVVLPVGEGQRGEGVGWAGDLGEGSSTGREVGRARPAPAAPLGPPIRILPESRALRDPEVLGALEAGIELRVKGDSVGALERLMEADELEPAHPAVQHELALVYRQLGREDKATALWAQVRSLGEAGAGDYYALADLELSARPQARAGQVPVLRFGEVEAMPRTPPVPGSQEIVLRLALEAMPGAAIEVGAVQLAVYFFDLVDGREIDLTTADAPQPDWVTAPVDWAGGLPEMVDFTYYQPPMSPEEEERWGFRRYYGFLAKLYYRDELQDVVAMPRTLTEYEMGGSNSGPGEIERPAGGGPSSPLFPGGL
jgi:hypothetical protein